MDKTANRQLVVFLRNILLVCLVVFIFIAAIGVGLGVTHDRRMDKIEAECGFRTNCVRLYSRHHLGVTVWASTIFNIGVVGSGVSLVGLAVVLFSAKRSRQA